MDNTIEPTPLDEEAQLAQVLALSLNDQAMKSPEELLAEEEAELQRCLEMSLADATPNSPNEENGEFDTHLSDEELLARATALSLENEPAPSDTDLALVMELSKLEALPPPPLVQVTSDDDLELQQAIANSRQDAMLPPPLIQINSNDDLELQQALANSRTDNINNSHSAKAARMFKAAGHLPPGRHRRCLEVAKGIGGLIVGETS
jgi:hypothetical protein